MKAPFFGFLFWSTILAGCAVDKKDPAKLLLQDAKLQEEIFDAILADSIYLEKFLEKMDSDSRINTMHGRMMKRIIHQEETDSTVTDDAVFSSNVPSNTWNYIRGNPQEKPIPSEGMKSEKQIDNAMPSTFVG